MLAAIKSIFKPKVRVQIVRRDPFRLRMIEWRADRDLTRLAARALSDPTVRQMVDTLRTEHLANYSGGHRTTEELALFAAQCEGYGVCLNNFESLAVFAPPQATIEATFEETEQPPDQP